MSGHFFNFVSMTTKSHPNMRYQECLCPEICFKVMHCFSLLIFILVFYMQISKPLYFFVYF